MNPAQLTILVTDLKSATRRYEFKAKESSQPGFWFEQDRPI